MIEKAVGKFCQNCRFYKFNYVLPATFCNKKGRYLEIDDGNTCDDWEPESAEAVPVEGSRRRVRVGFGDMLALSDWAHKQVGKI